MNRIQKIILAFVLALSLPGVCRAQPPDQRWRDRARTFLVLRLVEKLDLPEDKALEVSKVLRESEGNHEKLLEERRGVEESLRAALGKQDRDEGELKRLIERASKIDADLALVPAQSFRELRKILTVEQQAKLALARPEIHQEIRQGVRRRLGEGGGPGGPEGGPRRRRPPARAE